MKVRQGFVSNSSSSSFIVITKKDHDNLYGLDEDIVNIYNQAFKPYADKIFGQDVLVYKGYSDCEGCYSITDLSLFEEYCDKHNVNDDDYWDLANKLYNKFTSYFKDDGSFISWGD